MVETSSAGWAAILSGPGLCGLKPEDFHADRNIYLRGEYMVSGIEDSSDTPQYSTLCPLPWFVKTEDILTLGWGKVAITWRNDKQMEDKP